MSTTFPASKQGPLTTGERLCDLAFLDAKAAPLSLYESRIFGWPKVIHLAASPEAMAEELARFARLAPDFARTECHVLAVSRAAPADNAAMVRRLKLPFALLSDDRLALTRALSLPTLRVNGLTLLKRLTLVLRDGAVEHVFYPVFPPDKAAEEVIIWLLAHPRRPG